MARLGLKNYQTPNFKIPTIAPDQRPINQLSKFMQWLHSIVDWKVKDDNEKEEDTSADGEKEPMTKSTTILLHLQSTMHSPVRKNLPSVTLTSRHRNELQVNSPNSTKTVLPRSPMSRLGTRAPTSRSTRFTTLPSMTKPRRRLNRSRNVR